ncbi:MAG: hypothetical protein IPG82_15920 [Saprospiraceae bacterium]|nr:hypothetical protein [Saprospiraceae bacterium]
MTTIVQDFITFKASFPRLLDVSGYKMDFLAKRLGMSPTSFSNKKKRNSFTPQEMQALLDIVWNDYLETISLGNAMQTGQAEGQLTEKATQAMFDAWRS